MRLSKSIAITLGFITCLSSFMLGLGQEDFLLPFLMFVAAAASIYLTDFRRWIRLGDWTVNIIILLIVFSSLGEIFYNLFNYRNEALAFSIARTLVFIEMVLLFREKETRFCWQILLISLLQVVVAATMQQSLFFGFLLIVYVFTGLCVFVQIFLQKEYRYYRHHSYQNTFIESLRAEIAARQDRGRLVRIALTTLLTGPFSLLLSYSGSGYSGGEKDQTPERSPGTSPEKTSENMAKPKDRSGWELLRSLFAVFPDDDAREKEHWETVETSRQTNDVDNDESSPSWYSALWEDSLSKDPATLSDLANPAGNGDMTETNWASVPKKQTETSGKKRSRSSRISSTIAQATRTRFPLLKEQPAFSAGTSQNAAMAGGQWELFKHLLRGTLFSLLVAVFLFCLIPRTGKVDFLNYQLSFGQSNWTKSFRPPVNTIGFTEEIRLGSLGTVIPHYRGIMSIQLSKRLDKRIPPPNAGQKLEIPYREIQGSSIYLRGVALDSYSHGIWKHSRRQNRQIPRRFDANVFSQQDAEFENLSYNSEWFTLERRPGMSLPAGHGEDLFFEPKSDLVAMNMFIQPLDTTVFFAPWPFFVRNDSILQILPTERGDVRETRRRETTVETLIYTTAFKSGQQLPLTPCQEQVNRKALLNIPDENLGELIAQAKKWDAESGLPEEDIIGRARYLESQFLHAGRFQYKLGGTTRNLSLDPLEDFIKNSRTGHCEFFAGALAMMLRSVGIGSHVVVGFKADASSEGADIQVRQSDAHAWVEAFLPPEHLKEQLNGSCAAWWKDGGWLRLDPTPAARDTVGERSVSFRLSDINEKIQLLWSNYVLNMNSSKQADWIYGPIKNTFSYLGNNILNIAFWKEAGPDILRYYRELFFKGRTTVWSAKDWVLISLPALIFAMIFYLVFRLLGPILPWLFRQSDRSRRRKATIEFYVAMERLLSKIKSRKHGETPLEYIRQFDFGNAPRDIVDVYYRVRFGETDLTTDELNCIRGDLDQLERRIKNHDSKNRDRMPG